MIFDDLKPQAREPEPQTGHGRRRRRRRSRSSSGERRRRSSTFETASRLSEVPISNPNTAHAAWLWVLGLLVVGAMAFAYYLHSQRSPGRMLPGDPPSSQIAPFADTILAPLETGTAAIDADGLSAMESHFLAQRQEAALDDKDIYGKAATLAGILREALADRERHLERLSRIAEPGENTTNAPDKNARQHLELAVSISWQRNSATYRNRADELLAHLTRLEQYRFRPATAPGTESRHPSVPEND